LRLFVLLTRAPPKIISSRVRAFFTLHFTFDVNAPRRAAREFFLMKIRRALWFFGRTARAKSARIKLVSRGFGARTRDRFLWSRCPRWAFRNPARAISHSHIARNFY